MESKPANSEVPPTQVSRQNTRRDERPSRVAPTQLLAQSHFFASARYTSRARDRDKERATRPNPCLKKSLPLRIAFRLPGFLAALPVSWESPRRCWRRGERWRAWFSR